MKNNKSLLLFGWGNKFSGLRAKLIGSILGLRYVIKEDVFLRSISRNHDALSEVKTLHPLIVRIIIHILIN